MLLLQLEELKCTSEELTEHLENKDDEIENHKIKYQNAVEHYESLLIKKSNELQETLKETEFTRRNIEKLETDKIIMVANSERENSDLKKKITSLKETLEGRDMEGERLISEHRAFKLELQKCEINLKLKEDALLETNQKLKEAEEKIRKIESFVESEKEKVALLEKKIQESEKVLCGNI